MEGVTWALAKFAVNLKSEDLDPGLVLNFKKYLLDGIGCGLYGSCLPWSQIVNRFIKEQRGKKESTLWLQKFKGPSTNVSLGLGVMIHSFDFDDYHNAKVHPGAVVIPAAVAMGERLGANGKLVLFMQVARVRVNWWVGSLHKENKSWIAPAFECQEAYKKEDFE